MFAIYDDDPGETEVDRCCDKYRSNSNTYQVPGWVSYRKSFEDPAQICIYSALCSYTNGVHRSNENVIKIGDKLTS